MKRQPNIENYTAHKPYKEHDYVELRHEGGMTFGICEIEGIRYKEQEDAIILTTKEVAILPTLPPSIIHSAFKKTFSLIQETYGQVDYLGTTCCSVTAWLDKRKGKIITWTANLGDSSAFLIIIDKTGKIQKAESLHPLHDTCGILNKDHRRLTRGFGDIHSEARGFSHHPDIFHAETPFFKDDEVWIVVACDGLTECNKVTANGIGQIISLNYDKSPENIAEALVNTAYHQGRGSTDNISVGVFEVSEIPASLTVFDGHGGLYRGKKEELKGLRATLLVKNISEHFYSLFIQQLQSL